MLSQQRFSLYFIWLASLISSGLSGVDLEIRSELARSQVEHGHVHQSMPWQVRCDQYVINTKELAERTRSFRENAHHRGVC